MTSLYIDGTLYTLYIKSISEGSNMREEIYEFYSDEPFIASASPDARAITIAFAIYDVNAETIARDLEARFRARKQFIMWIEEYNIIHGHKYIIVKPDRINLPRDTDDPNLIKGTMSLKVAGIGSDYSYVENNYVRIKYRENIWNLEGSS